MIGNNLSRVNEHRKRQIMTTLKAEKRDMSVKAKALRRQGQVSGSIYGREMAETLHIQMAASDVERFTKSNEGSQVIIDLDGKKINALVKEATYEPLLHTYLNVDFQALVEGETVTSTAQIILHNEEKVAGYLHQVLSEVTYKAVPSALVEKIEIDVAGMNGETSVFVSDLDIAKNKDIALVTPEDSLVFNITEHQKGVVEETAPVEEAAEEPEA